MLFLIVTLLISDTPPPTPVFDEATSSIPPVIRRVVRCGWVPVIDDNGEWAKQIMEDRKKKGLPTHRWICQGLNDPSANDYP
jgi:hypothetical protein